MQPVNMTDKYRADLRAQNDRARAFLRERTDEARAFGAEAPQGEPDKEQRLWNKAGYFAGFFVVWALMLWLVVLAWSAVFG